MTDPRFILAKYAPDIQRMEPRNVGIFLWHKGRILARFLEEKDASFINDFAVYREWIAYWNELISADQITAPGLPEVSKKSEDCLRAILSTQDGNYILVDAGFVPAPMTVKDMPKAVDFLFGELVAPQNVPVESEDGIRQPSFQSRCDALFDDIGIEVHHDKLIELRLFQGTRQFPCNYYIGNGHPDAIFQRANLDNSLSVNSTALMLHQAIDESLVSRDRCGALVRRNVATSPASIEGYEWLSRICTIIDVESHDAADRVAALLPAPAIQRQEVHVWELD